MRLRRFDHLTYGTQAPTAVPIPQAFMDLADAIRFGTTTSSWRRRCEASLRASRRRRGLA
jgi:hypothetical protein